MNWLVALIVSIVMPVIQPVVQTGVARVQERVQARMAHLQPPVQPAQIVYHNGSLWAHENGQWRAVAADTITSATPVYWNDGQRWWCQIGEQRYVYGPVQR